MEHLRYLEEVYKLFPYLNDACSFLQNELVKIAATPSSITDKEAPRIYIPVACLRWTHSDIEQHLYFRHDEDGNVLDADCRQSMYKTLDMLIHGKIHVEDLPPLEVVVRDGKVWCLSNRRLTDLKMYQATQQHKSVRVPCVVRIPDSKFTRSRTTECDGLGIRPRGGPDVTSQHLGVALFNQAEQTMAGLARIVEKHPNPSLDNFLRSMITQPSRRRLGEDTISLPPESVFNRCSPSRSRSRPRHSHGGQPMAKRRPRYMAPTDRATAVQAITTPTVQYPVISTASSTSQAPGSWSFAAPNRNEGPPQEELEAPQAHPTWAWLDSELQPLWQVLSSAQTELQGTASNLIETGAQYEARAKCIGVPHSSWVPYGAPSDLAGTRAQDEARAKAIGVPHTSCVPYGAPSDETVSKTLVSKDLEFGMNDGRNSFSREKLPFWGFGGKIGAKDGWSHNNTASMFPPAQGSRMPWDRDVVGEMTVPHCLSQKQATATSSVNFVMPVRQDIPDAIKGKGAKALSFSAVDIVRDGAASANAAKPQAAKNQAERAEADRELEKRQLRKRQLRAERAEADRELAKIQLRKRQLRAERAEANRELEKKRQLRFSRAGTAPRVIGNSAVAGPVAVTDSQVFCAAKRQRIDEASGDTPLVNFAKPVEQRIPVAAKEQGVKTLSVSRVDIIRDRAASAKAANPHALRPQAELAKPARGLLLSEEEKRQMRAKRFSQG